MYQNTSFDAAFFSPSAVEEIRQLARQGWQPFDTPAFIGHVDYFRVPRHPSRLDAKRGHQFLQADFKLLILRPRDHHTAKPLYEGDLLIQG